MTMTTAATTTTKRVANKIVGNENGFSFVTEAVLLFVAALH